MASTTHTHIYFLVTNLTFCLLPTILGNYIIWDQVFYWKMYGGDYKKLPSGAKQWIPNWMNTFLYQNFWGFVIYPIFVLFRPTTGGMFLQDTFKYFFARLDWLQFWVGPKYDDSRLVYQQMCRETEALGWVAGKTTLKIWEYSCSRHN